MNFKLLFLAFIPVILFASQPDSDILEKFLAQDLDFRNECINNDRNDDCAFIRDALFKVHKHGCAARYLDSNIEYLADEYNKLIDPQQKKSHSLRPNPKVKTVHDAFIIHLFSQQTLQQDQDFYEQFEAAATRLIIEANTKLAHPGDHKYLQKQLDLAKSSLENAFNNHQQKKEQSA